MSFTLYALDKTWGPNPMKVGFFLEQLGLKYTLKTVTMNSVSYTHLTLPTNREV